MKFLNAASVKLLAVAAIVAVATPAWAATVSPTKSNGDFIPGSGIPADNFTANTAGTGETVAAKGRLRDTGQALSQVGNIYYVPTGLAADNTNPAWSVDWQFTPAAGSSTGDYWIESFVDFDPAVGATDFLQLGPTQVSPASGGYASNPGGGAWSDDTIPFVLADSFHLGFPIWTLLGKSFDPNVPGEYQFVLNAYANNGGIPGAQLASTSILVRSGGIPEPATIGMAGVAAIAGLAVRRKARRA